MAIYVYERLTPEGGREIREIFAHMTSPPPERILIDAAGDWTDCPAGCPEGWRRVYGEGVAVSAPDHAVAHGREGSPVSRSLPLRKGGVPDKLDGRDVLRHSDGSYSTLTGQAIVRNRRDAENERARTGMVRE